MTTTAPAFVLDALGGLIEAEEGSVFRSMGDNSPYLTRADAAIRRPLAQMWSSSHRHAVEIARLVDSLGGTSPHRIPLRPDVQLLGYLSLKFLLPKLVTEKDLVVARYENARRAIGKAQPEAAAMLDRHLGELRAELAMLRAAAEGINARPKAG